MSSGGRVAHKVHSLWDGFKNPGCGLVDNPPVLHALVGHDGLHGMLSRTMALRIVSILWRFRALKSDPPWGLDSGWKARGQRAVEGRRTRDAADGSGTRDTTQGFARGREHPAGGTRAGLKPQHGEIGKSDGPRFKGRIWTSPEISAKENCDWQKNGKALCNEV
jgi:hypothetical protein